MTAMPTQLIGSHPLVETVRLHVARIARSRVDQVLIYGETGTGKGLVARMIHEQSARARSPFINVNCAAIPGNLMESELFGHVKGAFTGAASTKQGLLGAADGGTLFLDEVPELELPLQAKLLTVLDSGQFRPVGSVSPVEANVRFIAATNRVLYHEVRAKRFRDDLYYRLLVVAVNLPALRDRGDDIFELTEHFLERFSKKYGRVVRGLEPAARDVFREYKWPGNVRQLQNVIERIFLLEDDNRILVKHIPPRLLLELDSAHETLDPLFGTPIPGSPHAGIGPVDFHAEVAKAQRAMLSKAFADSAGNIALAAQRLNLSRHAFRHYWSRLGAPAKKRR
jgi:two-component system response regulator AtoC